MQQPSKLVFCWAMLKDRLISSQLSSITPQALFIIHPRHFKGITCLPIVSGLLHFYTSLVKYTNNYWGCAVCKVLCVGIKIEAGIVFLSRHLGLSPPNTFILPLTFYSYPEHMKDHFQNLFHLKLNFISHFRSGLTTSHWAYPPDVLPIGTSKPMVKNQSKWPSPKSPSLSSNHIHSLQLQNSLYHVTG